MIDFLVKHLSELLKSRPEDVLTLPYCLLQEVLKSDRLTSLSEAQIWQVRRSVWVFFWQGKGTEWLKVEQLRNNDNFVWFGSPLGQRQKSCSLGGQVIGEHQLSGLRGLSPCSD